MKKIKKILITGVSGVFGSTLAIFLQDQGYFVEGLDIPNSSPPIDLGNIRVHDTNMLDVDALGILIKGNLGEKKKYINWFFNIPNAYWSNINSELWNINNFIYFCFTLKG